MRGRQRPSVLVVARDRAECGRIATLLEEAGIIVAAVADGQSALAAADAGEFDLAIAWGPDRRDEDAAAWERELRDRQPGLELLVLNHAIAPARSGPERRWFVGSVRERLLRAHAAQAERELETRAEACIASAKVACLHQRRMAAESAGAPALAAALHREIEATVAERHTAAAAERHAVPGARTPALA